MVSQSLIALAQVFNSLNVKFWLDKVLEHVVFLLCSSAPTNERRLRVWQKGFALFSCGLEWLSYKEWLGRLLYA